MCLRVQSVIRYAAGAGAVVLALALSTASAAANTIDLRAEYLDSSYVNRATCDFPIRVHEFGSYKVTDFYDGDGTLYKETITSGGEASLPSRTAPRARLSRCRCKAHILRLISTRMGPLTRPRPMDWPSASPRREMAWCCSIPAGLSRAPRANVIWSAGPHQFRVDGDVAAFCAAFG